MITQSDLGRMDRIRLIDVSLNQKSLSKGAIFDYVRILAIAIE